MADQKVTRLEAQMEHVLDELGRLKSVPADVSAMKVAIDNLPTRRDITDALDRHLKFTLMIIGLMLTAATVIISFFHR